MKWAHPPFSDKQKFPKKALEWSLNLWNSRFLLGRAISTLRITVDHRRIFHEVMIRFDPHGEIYGDASDLGTNPYKVVPHS